MARNIKRSFSIKECKQGIYSVGKNHIVYPDKIHKSSEENSVLVNSLNLETVAYSPIKFTTINVLERGQDYKPNETGTLFNGSNISEDTLVRKIDEKVLFYYANDMSFKYFSDFESTKTFHWKTNQSLYRLMS